MHGIAVKEQYYTHVNRKNNEFIEHKVIEIKRKWI